jgi:hypothetical protein
MELEIAMPVPGSPNRRPSPPPFYPPVPAPTDVNAALSYESPRPKRSRLKRAWLWVKYRYEGPVGNVLAVAVIILIVVAYVAFRYALRTGLLNPRN